MDLSGDGVYTQMKIHSTLTCVSCHMLTQNYGTGTGATKMEHAATVPSCLKCHSGVDSVMNFDVANELNASTEAHQNFNDDAACIGCHTQVEVSGTVTYQDYNNSVVRSGLTIGGN